MGCEVRLKDAKLMLIKVRRCLPANLLLRGGLHYDVNRNVYLLSCHPGPWALLVSFKVHTAAT